MAARTGSVAGGSRERTLAVSGIVGILVFWVTVLVLGSLDPDYSHLEHAMSLVGSIQAPYSPIGRAAFVLEGLLLVAFSVGLYRHLRPGPAGIAGVAMITIHGIGRIGEGVFAWNVVQLDSLSNVLHTAFGVPALLAMLAAPFLLAWTFRTDDRWRGFYPYTLGAAIAFLVVFVVIGPFSASGAIDVPSGLGQRIGFGIWYLWLIGVAVGLYRREAPVRE